MPIKTKRPTLEATLAARRDPLVQEKIKAVYGFAGDDPWSHEEGSVLVAYEWLDAQAATGRWVKGKGVGCKDLIERWAGFYVGFSHVVIAAELHPEISGTYPDFNLPKKFIRPNDRRLEGIPGVGSMGYEDHDTKYQNFESRRHGQLYP